jgi:Mn2+/Fe2+ NRAMP family transporter
LTTGVAVFGTTISPYLFFWQSAPGAHPRLRTPSRTHRRTGAGAGRSPTYQNRHPRWHGPHESRCTRDHRTTASTLERKWEHGHSDVCSSGRGAAADCGFPCRLQEAKAFYGTVALATVVGDILEFCATSPMKALYWSAVINGVVAVPIMTTMMLVTSRFEIMSRSPCEGG